MLHVLTLPYVQTTLMISLNERVLTRPKFSITGLPLYSSSCFESQAANGSRSTSLSFYALVLTDKVR
ncbi:Uncharacterized protein HZ326_20303 [Fusarium oxysporum f. sp. albedinis]|nr:Uncharacterized protein HZ326_20303 [Fusarium oxysporum f. sp. albedinis]